MHLFIDFSDLDDLTKSLKNPGTTEGSPNVS